MANTAMSEPGVYISEVDKSFLSSLPAGTGPCFIGVTERGQAFVPTVVNNVSSFITQFGGTTRNSYLPYAALSYLRNSGPVTIIRTLGEGTITQSAPGGAPGVSYYITCSVQNGVNVLLAEIVVPSNHSISVAGNVDSFSITITESANKGVVTYTGLSFNPNSSNYIKKILNTNPNSNISYYYVKGVFSYEPTLFSSTYNVTAVKSTLAAGSTMGMYPARFGGNLTKYSNARSGWIISQTFGNTSFKLFRIHSINDGDQSNMLKFSIANIRAATNPSVYPYGLFDLQVRDISDTDENPIILESFNNLSLDPKSENYIEKVIGSQVRIWNRAEGKFIEQGKYPRRSKFIFVEMSDNIENVPPAALPYGFEKIPVPIGIVQGNTVVASFEIPEIYTSSSPKVYFGAKIDWTVYDALSVSVTHSLGYRPGEQVAIPSENDAYFRLENCTSCSLSLLNNSSFSKFRKFTVPLYKGFDAINKTVQINYSSLPQSLASAFETALSIVSNEEEVTGKELYIPGVSDPSIVSKAASVVEERKDMLYVADMFNINDNIADAIEKASTIDSSYCATYFPWVKIYDAVERKNVFVPPSVMVSEVLSKIDATGNSWDAPAGMNRGVVDRVLDTYVDLNSNDRENLYNYNINPIAKFQNFGVVIWGQKTLQKKPSKLDRINVRRLILDIKHFVRRISLNMVFEQGGHDMWNWFINEVTPYLQSIKNNGGLYDFSVTMDESLNTPETESRGFLYGNIRLVPQAVGEFWDISIVISHTGLEFLS